MPDIIDQIRDAMAAKEYASLIYTLIPQLIRMHDEGQIVVLPSKEKDKNMVTETVRRVDKCVRNFKALSTEQWRRIKYILDEGE